MSDYWSQYDGKSVPLKGLLQWLSDEHEHVTDDEGELQEGWDFPVVNSMALQRWAIAEAVEVEYEYAVKQTHRARGIEMPIFPEDWKSREDAERELDVNLKDNEDREQKNRTVFFDFALVKRRKAGKIEDA